MNAQEQAWAGEFGDEYTKRNRVNWLQRVPFWAEMLMTTGVTAINEIGCNAGWNLLALRTVNPKLTLMGIDINKSAIEQAKALGLCANNWDVEYLAFMIAQSTQYPFSMFRAELTFTAGVLIHVPPASIQRTVQQIVDVTGRYVLAIEYEAQQEEEITYRGKAGLLWKRPYGQLYQDLGCEEVASGYLKPEDGFDNCTWWLLEKP